MKTHITKIFLRPADTDLQHGESCAHYNRSDHTLLHCLTWNFCQSIQHAIFSKHACSEKNACRHEMTCMLTWWLACWHEIFCMSTCDFFPTCMFETLENMHVQCHGFSDSESEKSWHCVRWPWRVRSSNFEIILLQSLARYRDSHGHGTWARRAR